MGECRWCRKVPEMGKDADGGDGEKAIISSKTAVHIYRLSM